MYKKILSILIITAVVLGACKEDLLDKVPLDKISSTNFNAEMALTGVYDGLQFDFVTQTHYTDTQTPLLVNRGGAWGALSNGSLDPFNARVFSFWQDHYKAIFLANDFLEKVEGVDLEESIKTRYIAEARFLRAFYHFWLTTSFGDIPFLDHVLEIEEARTVTRNPKAEVLSKILADLDFAIDNLPVTQSDVGRITKGAALGLKARLYLLENDWTNVKTTTEAIFALNKYELLDNYGDVFLFTNENNSEVIFDVQFMAPDIGEGNRFEQILSIKDRMRNGAFFLQPSKFIVDMYETVDGSPIDPNDEYANRDPRFYASVLYPGATIYGKVYDETAISFRKGRTKFLTRKFTIEDDGGTTNAKPADAPNNWIHIRYADVMLMWAEAANELSGPDTEVYSKVDSIRSRAGITLLPTGLDKAAMREAIRKERTIELAFEGTHRGDMFRWMAPSEIKSYVENNLPQSWDGTVIEERIFDPTKNMLFPIPQQEIDNVPTLLPNNPGWQ
jgi:starch-binding outer membrane protein, SusD/RagB family